MWGELIKRCKRNIEKKRPLESVSVYKMVILFVFISRLIECDLWLKARVSIVALVIINKN